MGGIQGISKVEWVYTVLHLAVWAQVGVLVRTFLQKFFVLGCGGGWGPCLSGMCASMLPSEKNTTCKLCTYIHHTGGVYVEVLPPNMLGTFIIGLVATSAMVQIDQDKAIVILGTDHPWQSNAALQAGIRTGLCGSITTFSSWMLEAMTTCFTGNQWLTGIGQLVVGYTCVAVSFVLGTQMALVIHHRKTRGTAPLENEMLNYSRKEADYVFGYGEDPERVSGELEAIEPDLPLQRPLSKTETTGSDYKVIGADTIQHVESKSVEKERRGSHYHVQGIDHVAVMVLVLLTVGASFGVAFETQHYWIRNIWLSVLFAPFGCIGRWLLSKLNYKMKNSWNWFPVGTLVANWIGVILDYVLQSIQIRVVPGYWGSLIIDSIETGFCGCLTTVSTLVAEIIKMSELLPFSLRAYVYTAITFVGAFMFGLCFLGWVFWT